ncbi:MAG: NAD(P)H-dependent oxidoreductase [Sphingomonadaceae bacterium]
MNSIRSSRSAPKHVVILCHPDENSFNASVASTYCETVGKIGHEAVLRDLYRIGFDPVLKLTEQPGRPDFQLGEDVARELDLIQGADAFVLIYPIWFGTPPAMMKGYVERVFGSGFSHRAVRARQFHPMMSGSRLLSFTSSGTTKQWLEEQGAWRSLRQLFDSYIAHAFSLDSHQHIHFSAIVDGLKARFVEENLEQVRQQARQICSDLASCHAG